MHWASESGHREVVQTLLEHGADMAAINKVGAAGVPRACRGRRRGGARACLRQRAVPVLVRVMECRGPLGRASPPAEAAIVAVALLLTARLLSRTGRPACTKPPSPGALRWCRRCWSTAPTSRRGPRWVPRAGGCAAGIGVAARARGCILCEHFRRARGVFVRATIVDVCMQAARLRGSAEAACLQFRVYAYMRREHRYDLWQGSVCT